MSVELKALLGERDVYEYGDGTYRLQERPTTFTTVPAGGRKPGGWSTQQEDCSDVRINLLQGTLEINYSMEFKKRKYKILLEEVSCEDVEGHEDLGSGPRRPVWSQVQESLWLINQEAARIFQEQEKERKELEALEQLKPRKKRRRTLVQLNCKPKTQ